MCFFCTAHLFTLKGIVYSFTMSDQNNNTLTLVLQIYVWFLKC